jgi:hypothetical protein
MKHHRHLDKSTALISVVVSEYTIGKTGIGIVGIHSTSIPITVVITEYHILKYRVCAADRYSSTIV